MREQWSEWKSEWKEKEQESAHYNTLTKYTKTSNSCITHASTCTESVHWQSSAEQQQKQRQKKKRHTQSSQESERYERKKKQIQNFSNILDANTNTNSL